MSQEATNRPWYQHEAAIVESQCIGPRTRIWAFAHVLPGARIGSDCNLCDHVFVENDVVVGDRVTIKSGVQLWDGVRLEDDVFVGPNATFTNDLFPRSRVRPERFMPTLVRKGASIGANATILCGLTIGPGAMVGAGAVVTRDVPANAIVAGNPARIRGYTEVMRRSEESACGTADRPVAKSVAGVSIVQLPEHKDLHGTLLLGELAQILPFAPAAFTLLRDVPSEAARFEQAHRKLEQFLLCVCGKCTVVVDDGRERSEIVLDSPSRGLYVGSMVWCRRGRFSGDSVLLRLTSESLNSSESIDTYSEFLKALGA